jgi:hypothetical protein
MRPYGGFDHNAQSLKVVTKLESRYAAFDGLNLTWETLEGLAKHNGPVRRPTGWLVEYDKRHPLDLDTHASAEAQVAAIADDIAYNNHDLDDGIRARVFTLEEAVELPLIGEAWAEARAAHPAMPRDRAITETVRRVINRMIQDVVDEAGRRIAALAPRSRVQRYQRYNVELAGRRGGAHAARRAPPPCAAGACVAQRVLPQRRRPPQRRCPRTCPRRPAQGGRSAVQSSGRPRWRRQARRPQDERARRARRSDCCRRRQGHWRARYRQDAALRVQ